MEKIIHKLINEFTEGVDIYTHNDSTWLIFTETKQWVIELTENKTLWYNYNFFKSVFAYASLDCVQNQHLITKWVEDNIINKVSDIHFRDVRDKKKQFDDTIENGVKETYLSDNSLSKGIEYTIENGVKELYDYKGFRTSDIKDTIQNGVKEALRGSYLNVDDVIQDGVRDTQYSDYKNQSWINGVIKKGVKETKSDDFNVSQFLCEEVIDKGVKETKYHMSKLRVDAYRAVDNGIKETKISPTHTMDGDWLDGDEKLDEIIKNGVKETNHVDVMKFFDNKMEDTLKNGVKSSIPRQYVGENIIDKVIDKGVIETHREICEYKHTVDHIIQTGVKETTALDPSFSVRYINGDFEMVPEVEKIIKNGVKKIMAGNYTDPSTSLLHIKWEAQIEDVIDNGNKVCGTYVGGHRQEEKTETVIEYGKQI